MASRLSRGAVRRPGFRSRRRPTRRLGARRGFTLLELLVTLLLVGLVTSFAVLALPGESSGQRQQQEAQRLLARMRLVREEAVLRMHSLGIQLHDHGYRFVEHVDGRWRPLDGRGFAPYALPESLRLVVDVEGQEITLGGPRGEAADIGEVEGFGDSDDHEDRGADEDTGDPRPQIYFLPGGEVIPPFSIRLISDDTMTEYRLHRGTERWLALSRDDL